MLSAPLDHVSSARARQSLTLIFVPPIPGTVPGTEEAFKKVNATGIQKRPRSLRILGSIPSTGKKKKKKDMTSHVFK
jgi:hypothetical protein